MSEQYENLELQPCPSKTAIKKRKLFTESEAETLSEVFKTLASGTRLRLLHALVREGELCVSKLAKSLQMKPQAVSNQLQRMSDRGVVDGRRDGSHILYRLVDPCVVELLDRGFCLGVEASNRTKTS
jgi:DNA-binding transcriptional ArsR family regulator